MDWFDFELGEGFFRKMIGGIGRVLLFFLDLMVDLFTFWWEPTEKREQRKEKRRRRGEHPPKQTD
jgi:hypothetical protein